MDAGYDALEEAASSYAKNRDRADDTRSHKSHRDRDYEREDRGPERRHRRDDKDERYRDRERDRDAYRGDRGDRDHGRERDYRPRDRERERDRGYEARDRYDRFERDGRGAGGFEERPPRRRRRDEEEFTLAAEPMHGHRDRRPRYDEPPEFAEPMRGNWSPPRRKRDDGFRGGRGDRDGGRRGGGGGGGGGGRFYEDRRSPTPDGTLSLEERKEKLSRSLWDTAPVQFQGVSALEAKTTGLFTYGPGRVPPPAHLGIPATFVAGAFPPSNPVRQNNRLYIGGIKEDMQEKQIQDFFNNLMKEKGMTDGKEDPVKQCQINNDRNFAFIELHTPEQATAALELDGVVLDGASLRVRRPKDYAGIDPLLQTFNGVVAPSVADSPNKLFIGGIPTYLNDEQVMELLKSFGELKSFNLVKESAGVSKGFAFAEYLDPEVTDMAIQGLHNFALGDRNLVVQRAAVGRNTGVNAPIPGSAAYLSQAIPHLMQSNSDAPTSRVMLLLNMVTPEELYNDDDYNDIIEDINDECSKYGEIEGVRIPRPVPKSKKWESTEAAAATAERNKRTDDEAGVGRVYVMYKDVESTKKAMNAIGGRQFAGRTILVANVPEEEFLGPAPPPPPPEDAPAPAESDAPPPPPPADLDAAADAALKDIMSGI
ncbi:splicing factor U2AF 65 kDa subunit [Cryptococcus bacillisporus CA1873]|uniref:Splicing factor U2AF 65 kDa subunit n=1 Tax=Cryptococcus bacillisporus CA1873 TaxID=1296111 RepID=A0ABR5BDB5_CRYGA|nr:splicing factor U2AF 65 kDa subunit [Cryptococcus bacillisporus CA1873]|eukprot:KIR63993.1 splicing factor U2AF 65 kDa subunit [Cryptococcus gattii CA1873]